MVHFQSLSALSHCQPLSTTHIRQNMANTMPHHHYWQCLTQPQGRRSNTMDTQGGVGQGGAKKYITLFLVLFYCTYVCYKPLQNLSHSWPTTHHLSSANSSMQMLKLACMLEFAKLSVSALGQPPLTTVLQIQAHECSNWQNGVFLLLADHPSPRFCKFEHTSARIGKTEHSYSWLTTPCLGSANSST